MNGGKFYDNVTGANGFNGGPKEYIYDNVNYGYINKYIFNFLTIFYAFVFFQEYENILFFLALLIPR